MPRIKEADRIRAGAPKVRSGCGTCKRVKCDEAKPICQKCINSKVKCDGYEQPTPKKLSLIPGPSTAVSQDPKELRSFQFYQQKTIEQLTTSFMESFWSNCILQVAQTEASIQHGIFTLAAVHEHFLNAGEIEKDASGFALFQYNKSIRGLLENPGSTFIQLLSGLIFMSIETLQGHYLRAVELYKHARALFEQLQLDKNQVLHLGAQFVEVEDFMRRVALHMHQIIGDVDRDLCINIMPNQQIDPLSEPGIFFSFDEARVYIEKLVYAYTIATSFNPGSLTVLDARMAQWKSSLAALIEKIPHPSLSQKRSIALLNMYHTQFELFQEAEHAGEETVNPLFWNSYCDRMRTMVDFAEEAIRHQDSEAISFSYDIGIVGALMGVVSRCRDPLVRRKAISVLRSSYRQECLWNSKMVANSAERFMSLEENGCVVRSCSDILPSSRLKYTHLVYGKDMKDATVEYGFMMPDRVARQMITW